MYTKVLIIDDDPDIVSQTRDYLDDSKREHYTLESAGTLKDAYRVIKSQGPFDLILLDHHLPDGMGVTAIPEIRSRTTAPIIIITGVKDKMLQNQALELGAADYLEKGYFNSDLLCRACRAAVQRHQDLDPGAALDPVLSNLNNVIEMAQEIANLQRVIMEEITKIRREVSSNIDLVRQDTKEHHVDLKEEIQGLSKLRWLLTWVTMNPKVSLGIFLGFMVVLILALGFLQALDPDKITRIKSLFE